MKSTKATVRKLTPTLISTIIEYMVNLRSRYSAVMTLDGKGQCLHIQHYVRAIQSKRFSQVYNTYSVLAQEFLSCRILYDRKQDLLIKLL